MHLVSTAPERRLIRETDNGEELRGQISYLEVLYDAFKNGDIKEIY